MNVIIIEDGLVILLLEIENTDSLLFFVSPTAVSLRFAPFNFRYPDKLGIEDEFDFLILEQG